MLRYVARRLFQAVIILFGVSFLSFSLLYIFPGDPAELIFLVNSGGVPPTPKDLEEFRAELGLNKPLLIQYVDWLSRVLNGDLGNSWNTGRPVIDEISQRLKASAELFLLSFAISAIMALIFGIMAAINKDKIIDHICRIVSLLGISIPNFWFALILIWVFSVKLHLLPSFGYGRLENYILPVVAWVFSATAIKSRFVRATMLEVLNQEYIITARSKGLTERVIILKHALRNALIPIMTYFSTSIGHLVLGSIMIEVVFAWPGVARFFIFSVFTRDFPVVQAFVLLSSVAFIFMNLIVDLSYAIIDPRVRYEKG